MLLQVKLTTSYPKVNFNFLIFLTFILPTTGADHGQASRLVCVPQQRMYRWQHGIGALRLREYQTRRPV